MVNYVNVDAQQIYHAFVNGRLIIHQAAEALYNTLGGITKIEYIPRQKFTAKNHLYKVSIPEAKEQIKPTLRLVKSLKDTHPEIFVEAHLGKRASSKHHKEGLEFILENI